MLYTRSKNSSKKRVNLKVGVMIDELHTGGIEKIAIQQVDALKRIGKKAGLIVLRRVKIEAHPYSEFLKNTPVIYLDDRLPRWFKFSFKIPFFSYFSLFRIRRNIFVFS